MMGTLEKFYIFREIKLNDQINDKLTVKPNIIFETTVHKDPHTGLSAPKRPSHSHTAQSWKVTYSCTHGKDPSHEISWKVVHPHQ